MFSNAKATANRPCPTIMRPTFLQGVWEERRDDTSKPTTTLICYWRWRKNPVRWMVGPVLNHGWTTHISHGMMNANTHLLLSSTATWLPLAFLFYHYHKVDLGFTSLFVLCMVCECQTKFKMMRHLKWLVTTICCWRSNVMMEVTICSKKEFNTTSRWKWPL